MVAVLMLALLPATSLVVAASMRLDRFSATLLAAYIALVAETSAVTLALSPLRELRRGPLALSEIAVLALALVVWWQRGKPGLGLSAGARAVVAATREPVVVVFLAVIAVALAYELVLVLTVPANNWDSLTYHLSRVAAWVQHGGLYWIPHAPTDRMNEFQPLAEQEILFLFVATGKGALFGLPQYVAQLAILVAIYRAARRLGYGGPPAACASLSFATFSLVALEATTSQNDLVAASFPVAAAALLLGGGTAEVVLAGIAVGLGLGVKLTTVLVLPVLVVLAWTLGRRRFSIFAVASAAAFVALGMWSFVLNVAETGHVLGRGGGRVENTASPSLTRGLSTAYRLLDRLLDLTGFGSWAVWGLLLTGGMGAIVVMLILRRRQGSQVVIGLAVIGILLPLAAPKLIASFSFLLQSVRGTLHLPGLDSINERAHEDVAAFGPLAGPAVVGLSVYSIALALKRRGDWRRVALGLAFLCFLVLLVPTATYNHWLSRFLVVPIALTAPLFATFFRRRTTAIAILITAATTLALALVHNELKPLSGPGGRPWKLTQAEAVALTWKPAAESALVRLDTLVAPNACVGAVLGEDDPSYLLYGPRLGRRVTFLQRDKAPQAATRAGIPYVVIGTGEVRSTASFEAQGWTMRPLFVAKNYTYWLLAISPTGGAGSCYSQTAAVQAATPDA